MTTPISLLIIFILLWISIKLLSYIRLLYFRKNIKVGDNASVMCYGISSEKMMLVKIKNIYKNKNGKADKVEVEYANKDNIQNIFYTDDKYIFPSEFKLKRINYPIN